MARMAFSVQESPPAVGHLTSHCCLKILSCQLFLRLCFFCLHQYGLELYLDENEECKMDMCIVQNLSVTVLFFLGENG
jgi:hypothetical protein